MRVFLTGASGYIGGAVGRALIAEGHDVVGLARSDGSADRIRSDGMEVTRGDLTEPASLEAPSRKADAVVHTGAQRSADAGAVDARAVDAILAFLEGTAKPFVYTSGVWVLGDTGSQRADEAFRAPPPEVVAWRLEVEETVVEAASRDIASSVVRPGVVYGEAGGMLGGMVSDARGEGSVRVVGDGRQIWSLVHIADLADIYLRLLGAEAGFVFNAATWEYSARDLALAACVVAGVEPEVVELDLRDAADSMGPVAGALAMSQRVSSSRAVEELGWNPAGPTPLEELVVGSYSG